MPVGRRAARPSASTASPSAGPRSRMLDLLGDVLKRGAGAGRHRRRRLPRRGQGLLGPGPARAGRDGQARPRAAPRAARLRRQVGGGRLDLRLLARRPSSALVDEAVALARITAPDALSGLPDPAELAQADARTSTSTTPPATISRPRTKIELARRGRGRGARGRSAHHQLRGRRVRRPPRPLRLRLEPRLRRRLRDVELQPLGLARSRRENGAACSATAGTTSRASAPASTRRRRSAARPPRARCGVSAPAR